jgi:hypothetical protein
VAAAAIIDHRCQHVNQREVHSQQEKLARGRSGSVEPFVNVARMLAAPGPTRRRARYVPLSRKSSVIWYVTRRLVCTYNCRCRMLLWKYSDDLMAPFVTLRHR